ncbi:hypothetical protein BC826DRAFT_630272 [Russula brevipes]|nr:hypothetical protein BC826DRAFT_630272 [Russula brevipes]
MALLSVVRIVLYCFLWVFSVVLLGLTAARIHYTENLSPDDPLNGGVHFHDPIIAELLATSILVILWSTFASVFCLQVFLYVARANPILSVHAIYMRCDRLVIHTFAVEAIALSMLFVMWLVGTAIATSMWGNLGWCHQYSPCRLLSALVGIAWTGWVFLLFLLGASLVHAFVNQAWTQPIHGHLYPRDSFVAPQTSEYGGSRL